MLERNTTMARARKVSAVVVSTNLNQYTREAAAAQGATFLSCWDEYHAAHPERFTPEAICFR